MGSEKVSLKTEDLTAHSCAHEHAHQHTKDAFMEPVYLVADFFFFKPPVEPFFFRLCIIRNTLRDCFLRHFGNGLVPFSTTKPGS